MRIITGTLGGRTFDSPKGHRTHPMSDKVRGALFSTLGDIRGLAVLDAFSGSGALSFESLSRGAERVVAVDVDAEAVKTIEKNADKLGVKENIQIVRSNVKGWSNRHQNERFDLVFCDPPYNDVQIETVEKLASHLANRGVLVMSLPPETRVILDDYSLLAHKKYGDAELLFYQRTT